MKRISFFFFTAMCCFSSICFANEISLVVENDFLDEMINNPAVLVCVVLVSILGVYFLIKNISSNSSKNKNKPAFDTSSPEQFFSPREIPQIEEAMQSVPTRASFDEDEIDPVAEADVYLAYGRDLQAEEILTEALQKNPENDQARLKLLEVYGRVRKDRDNFEKIIEDLRIRTGETGPVWDAVMQMVTDANFDFDSESSPVAEEIRLRKASDSIPPVVTPVDPLRRQKRDSVEAVSQLLSQMKSLVDSADLEIVTVEIEQGSESGKDRYKVTITLK